jgi:3-phosphoshikimate 1-carboxyvinyltransferase
MDRVVYPLQAMGARVRYLAREGSLPVELEARRSGSLRPLSHRPRVASAQVKSGLLLAGLTAGVRVEVREPAPTRDHTERLLRALGVAVGSEASPAGVPTIRIDPVDRGHRLSLPSVSVPGDFSSAAFLLAACWLGTGAVEVRGVGLNATRTGLLSVADEIGARYEVDRRADAFAGSAELGGPAEEPVGTVRAWPARLRAFEVDGRLLSSLVDEVPVLAVLAARASGVSRIRGAEELRRKESDRLAVLAHNLTAIGVSCRERPDGLDIEGTAEALAGRARPDGDHRIAMAFGALGVSPGCEISIEEPECVSVSYPGFWQDLERIGRSEAA